MKLFAFLSNNPNIYVDVLGCDYVDDLRYVGGKFYVQETQQSLAWPYQSEPQAPSFIYQMNIHQKDEMQAQYMDWIRYRFPNLIKRAEFLIKESVNARVKAICCKRESTINSEGIRYTFNNDHISEFGDRKMGIMERYFYIGYFNMEVRNVAITWGENGTFAWTAEMYAVDSSGADNPYTTNYSDDKGGKFAQILDYIGYQLNPVLFKKARFIFAATTIQSQGRCESNPE